MHLEKRPSQLALLACQRLAKLSSVYERLNIALRRRSRGEFHRSDYDRTSDHRSSPSNSNKCPPAKPGFLDVNRWLKRGGWSRIAAPTHS
jgi:hypothetical protein